MGLYELLEPGLENRADFLLLPVLGDIVVGPRSVVQPDLFVVPKPASADVRWRDVALRLLVVEVLSPGTAARDRGIISRAVSSQESLGLAGPAGRSRIPSLRSSITTVAPIR